MHFFLGITDQNHWVSALRFGGGGGAASAAHHASPEVKEEVWSFDVGTHPGGPTPKKDWGLHKGESLGGTHPNFSRRLIHPKKKCGRLIHPEGLKSLQKKTENKTWWLLSGHSYFILQLRLRRSFLPNKRSLDAIRQRTPWCFCWFPDRSGNKKTLIRWWCFEWVIWEGEWSKSEKDLLGTTQSRLTG